MNINIAGRHTMTYDDLKPDKWTHVAVTYDGTDQIMYINGKKVAQHSVEMPKVHEKDVIFIGMRSDTYEAYEGLIDEIKIYNDVVDIKYLYKK